MNNILLKKFLVAAVILASANYASAWPDDPDNAALLYYQAFCEYEKPDESMNDLIKELANGNIKPNPTIEKYIENCRSAINLVESAYNLDKCDWGLKYSEGIGFSAPFIAQSRMLSCIILADSRIAIDHADYDLAIQRCLTARKLGIDVGRESASVGFLIEKFIKRTANSCIQEILSSAAIDHQQLHYLKTELDAIDSRSKPLKFFLETDHDFSVMLLTPEQIKNELKFGYFDVTEEGTPILGTETVFNKEFYVKNKLYFEKYWTANPDSEFCRKNKAYFDKHWSEVLSVIDLPYQQVHEKLGALYQDPGENTDAYMTMLFGPGEWRVYNINIKTETYTNAIKAAIEIYQIKAKTGLLPGKLPVNLPKDLFSGEDFDYEKTADGFILRCRAKDLDNDEIYEYEFKKKS